jgi:ribonucleoside-diphosphate reductase alpha chain
VNESLSNLTVYMKYAKILPKGRRETWNEIVMRNKQMHLKKYSYIFNNNKMLMQELDKTYNMVLEKKILPSMRSLQFAGYPIEQNNIRMYNCCYLPINSIFAFREVLYLLLCGVGVGYSVQYHHINHLPKVNTPLATYHHTIEDSIEGWSNAVFLLFEAYLGGSKRPIFNYGSIRQKGSLIRSLNMAAPGPNGLKKSLEMVEKLLASRDGFKLSSVDIMDVTNIISECVNEGGIKRSAMICLFSAEDIDMAIAKTGEWWSTHPWRCRSNNSAVIYRGDKYEHQKFDRIWSILRSSGSGEPGFYFSNDTDREWGTNPCVETALRPYQFCNLSEINVSDVTSQNDLNDRARAASFIGTLQAGYTDFKYIRPSWRENTKKDSLLGIGMTGIAMGAINHLSLEEAADHTISSNLQLSKILNIPSAARLTCVKPSGTTSLVLGTSSGIHAIHSQYYIRHIRINKSEALYKYLERNHATLVEDEYGREQSSAVIKVPQNMDYEGAKYRTESYESFLSRMRTYNEKWVHRGHFSGPNKHNVSATISVRENEWEEVKDWLWEHRSFYTGVCCLPYDGGIYKQAPFQECTQLEYERLAYSFAKIDISKVEEEPMIRPLTVLDSACAGGMCDIK